MIPPESPAPETLAPVPWRARDAAWVYILTLAVTVLTIPLLDLALGGNALTVGVVWINEVALGVLTLTWVTRRYGATREDLGVRFPSGGVLPGVFTGLAGIGLSLAIGLLMAGLVKVISGSDPIDPDQVPLEGDPGTAILVATAIGVIVLAPIAEEMFFRGMLYRGLRRTLEPRAAAIVSGLVFGVAHVAVADSATALWQFTLIIAVPIAVLGMLFADVVERHRSLEPAIVAHMIFNTFGFVMRFIV